MKQYDYLINTTLKYFSNFAFTIRQWDSIALLNIKITMEYIFSFSYLIFLLLYYFSSFILFIDQI